ncbi:MAG TPA: sugar transferase [Flavisolibacter sp.]|jgi:lipopolysaccharide/colanic/teichoic acid biosynthesis glycosyltransferase|nr:sugar transferase [Flavisolibacter sp.]
MEIISEIKAKTNYSRVEEVISQPKPTFFRISRKNNVEFGLQGITVFEEIHAENYLSARTQLLRLLENNSNLPSLIIIDIPYVKREVKSFSIWLNKTQELSGIPVIYNKAHLNSLEVKEVRYSNVVDDIVEVDKNLALLSSKADFLRNVKECQSTNDRQESSSDFYKNQSPKHHIDYFLRRGLDIFVSSLIILLLLPVFVLITLAILIESKGPVIYVSDRAGRGYRIFKFLKFRTMFVGADNKRAELEKMNLYSVQSSSPHFFKIKNDPRITKVGAFLRNTSLDELPQLFNVLKGDMSLVGNRPLPLYEAATLTTNEWAERFMAPAGITGLWQIEKRGKEDMSVEERISLDIRYAKNNDLLKDLWIIAKTPTALFQKTNV